MTEQRAIGDIDIAEMIGTASHSGPWLVPLFTALRDEKIELAFMARNGKVQRFYPVSDDVARPIVVVVGDDDGDDRGPGGWPASIAGTISRSRVVMLNASGGEAHHYALAVQAALAVQTVLIIETTSQHVEAWLELLNGKSVITVLPRGGVHPVSAGGMQH